MKQIDAKMLEDAILFATEKHSGVVRKGNGLPYITHPLAVMAILLGIKKSNNPFLIAIVAICHDLVEDVKEVTIQMIADRYGLMVASLVQELTSDEEEIKRVGKDKYLLDKMVRMTSYALRIKLADRLHNVSDMLSIPAEKRAKYIVETNYILDGLFESKRKLTKTHLQLIDMIKENIKETVAV